MYRPAEFIADDREAVELIERFPFGMLISSRGQIDVTHVPFLVERSPLTLVSHVARGNPQWQRIADGDEVLCAFSGPNAYVSAGHYVDEPDVPTWNYAAVHVRGRYERIPTQSGVDELLQRTIDTFEQGRPEPWNVRSVPREQLIALARGVVGFRIRVDSVEGIAKLSQDKRQPDVDAVVHRLEQEGSDGAAVVAEMRRFGVSGRTGAASTTPPTSAGTPPQS